LMMEGLSKIVTKPVTTTPAKKEGSNSTLSTAVVVCSFSVISMENALRSNAKREHVGTRNSKPVFTEVAAIARITAMPTMLLQESCIAITAPIKRSTANVMSLEDVL